MSGGQVVKITRVYTGDDGESHFEDVEIPLEDRGPVGRISELKRATGILFRENEGDYHLDFHRAPRRQFVINLDGSVELEVGDGTRRLLRPGDVLLAEDTTGRGHISRAVDGRPRRSIFVTLD
jgi:quercetin dioxygenase-like cupin family protein